MPETEPTRHFDALVSRYRSGRSLTSQELEYLEQQTRLRGDFSTWMIMHAGEDADGLANAVAEKLANASPDALIRGVSGLPEELRHSGWHLLTRLAEGHPAHVDAIEAAVADWPAREKPWVLAWLEKAERGEVQPCFRLPRYLGLYGDVISPARLEALHRVIAGLHELDLSGCPVDEPSLRALGSSYSVAHLNTLGLRRTQLSDAGCAVLANSSSLQSLEELIISGNPLTARGLAAILLGPGMPRLREVDAGGSKIDLVDFARALADGPREDATPVALDVSQCTRTSEGLIALSRTPALRRIAGLALHHVKVSPAAANALSASPFASALSAFSVNDRSLGKSGVRALLEAPWIRNLRSLNLFNQGATDAVGKAFANLGGGAIERLDLLHNDLGRAASRALASADLSKLRELHISYNPIGDQGLAAILSNPTLASLEVLEAFDCGADVEAARALARAAHFRNLRTAILGDAVSPAAVRAMEGAALPALRWFRMLGAARTDIERLAADPAFERCYVTS
jgi:hypothetical protein